MMYHIAAENKSFIKGRNQFNESDTIRLQDETFYWLVVKAVSISINAEGIIRSPEGDFEAGFSVADMQKLWI